MLAENKVALFRAVDMEFHYIARKFRASKARADALVARNQNEIALVCGQSFGFQSLAWSPYTQFIDDKLQGYNMVAQHDAQITMRMNRYALADSKSIKTIAILTFVFLPSTAVAVRFTALCMGRPMKLTTTQAIFGTSFFSFGGASTFENSWSVAPEFWIFWATSIPLTIGVLVSWFLWLRESEKA